jgi:lipoprotein Spr
MQINSISIMTKNGYGKVIVVFSLLFYFGSLLSCGSKKVIHNTINTDEPAIVALREKYADILDVDDNKIKDIELYKNIDKWKAVKDSNMLSLGSLNVSFIQYLYFLNLQTRLPEKIDDLYKSRKTYLYRDCHFLEAGDLVFFEEKSSDIKEVGFYLDNKIFVAADVKGDLYFHHLQDSAVRFRVISNAKIIKDGE